MTVGKRKEFIVALGNCCSRRKKLLPRKKKEILVDEKERITQEKEKIVAQDRGKEVLLRFRKELVRRKYCRKSLIEAFEKKRA